MARNQLLSEVKFTYEGYRDFLGRIRDQGGRFRRFSDPVNSGDVLLRHDVDLSIERTLEMGRLEADMGIQSTFCFQVTCPLYNPLDESCRAVIREIDRLGHEVALHFNTHNYWDGSADAENPNEQIPDESALRANVRAEQSVLKQVTGTLPTTVSFHRPPEWVLDREFDGFRNTYAPEYFSEIAYIADSTQRWRRDPPALHDPLKMTQVLTHPGLWSESDQPFDRCVARGIVESCRRTNRWASSEFIDRPGALNPEMFEGEINDYDT